MAYVGLEKPIHAPKVAQGVPKTSPSQRTLARNGRLGDNVRFVNWLNENFLVASMIWGSVATGYLIYGWKQKAVMPLVGGTAMMAASFFIGSALLMSLACLAVMAIVYCLVKQGY